MLLLGVCNNSDGRQSGCDFTGGDKVTGAADTVLDLWLCPQSGEMLNLNFS